MAEATEAESAAAPAEPPAEPKSAISEEEVSALLAGNTPGAARPYDLTAVRINRTQLPLLETISKGFAERMAASLRTLLGRDASVQFTSLDSSKAGDLKAALPVPASLAVTRLKPLPGTAYVSVEPGLLLSLLDGFFGGTGRATADSQAATAPSALRFLALMLRSFAPGLAAAWAPVGAIEFELVKQETDPRLMDLGPAQDLMLVLHFTVELGERSGRIDWLLPESTLAPVREALAAQAPGAPARKGDPWGPLLRMGVQDAELETRAILAQTNMSLRELVKLSPGDIIPIETPQSVTLFAGDVPLYRGRFGVSQGRNALKILPGGLS